MNASVIAQHLKNHGIRVKASRNAALIALAADLPPAVLSDLFVLSTSAAVNWGRRASRDWHAFVGAAAHDRLPINPLTR